MSVKLINILIWIVLKFSVFSFSESLLLLTSSRESRKYSFICTHSRHTVVPQISISGNSCCCNNVKFFSRLKKKINFTQFALREVKIIATVVNNIMFITVIYIYIKCLYKCDIITYIFFLLCDIMSIHFYMKFPPLVLPHFRVSLLRFMMINSRLISINFLNIVIG